MILQITVFYNSFNNFDDVVLNTILNEWLLNNYNYGTNITYVYKWTSTIQSKFCRKRYMVWRIPYYLDVSVILDLIWVDFIKFCSIAEES